MSAIQKIQAYEILDSRGSPTVKAEVFLDNGKSADAAVPSGASKGIHEALELRDGDKTRYKGLGVLKSIDIIENFIAPKLIGLDPTDQSGIDRIMCELDGTDNKEKLGANSILAVSLAVARVAAYASSLPLWEYLSHFFDGKISDAFPIPMFNVINGGLHGGNQLSVQEFMIIPSYIRSFENRIRMGAEIYQSLKKLIKDNSLSVAVGDEGGFSPSIETDAKAIEMLETAIGMSGYQYITDVTVGLDMAASTYFENGAYRLAGFDHPLSTLEYIGEVEKLKNNFHLFSIEDALAEDEWDAWVGLTRLVGNDTMVVGDDLLVTNPKRLKIAIEKKACNAILVKVNQIGTLTETIDVIKMAKQAKFRIIISHRSGETVDDFISDLAIAAQAEYVKFGAPARGERVTKYNRLLHIFRQCDKNSG